MTKDELLRLIDEAAEDERPTLDLAGEGLDELPPEIGKLKQLKTLVLGRWIKKKNRNLGNNLRSLPDEIGQLKKLRSLQLCGNKFVELPEVISQLTNLRALDLDENKLSTFPRNLSKLINLRALYLSDNQLQEVPEIVGQFYNLKNLDLRANQLSSLPESIGQLSNLRSINLSGNKLSVFPTILNQLLALRKLYLTSNQLTAIAESIVKLSNLESLYLGNNNLSSLPENLEQLVNLKKISLNSNGLSHLPRTIGKISKLRVLNLSNTQLTQLPDDFGQLTNLKILNLISNKLTSLPTSFGQLINLEKLYLSFNRINTLPEDFGKLAQLEQLNLSSNQLTKFPEVVGGNYSLKQLDLSFNKLNTLPEVVGQLSQLEQLNLSSNQLTEIPEVVGGIPNLKQLDVSSNKLSALPEVVGQLSQLENLNLSSNQLNNLPKWAECLKAIDRLDLRGNPLPIPPEILGPKVSFLDPNIASEPIGFYFSLKTEEGSIPLYEAKLILVGEGGAGKTSLAKKIDDEDYVLIEDEESTEGIDVIRWDFPMDNGNIFRVNIWDFGGQEIYHATHQFFLTKRSLYLLVADTRQENTDFYYWLKIIELLSDSSPVLLIKNEKQNRQCEIDEGLFRSKFNNLKESFPTNLKEDRGLTDIKDAIRYHISRLPHVGTPLPKNWGRVRAALENYAQNCNTITTREYFTLCRQNGFTEEQKMLFLSSYLHDLGVCLHFQDDDLLKRTVILKPEWATTAVYKVADNDTVRKKQGRFTNADITDIWSDLEYRELRPELLKLMMRFKLAYEIPTAPGHYIAPQLLPISQPIFTWDDTDNLILRYRYDFMPKGILTRFIVETHKLIEQQNTVWKTGVILIDKWARAKVIEDYTKNEINIHVSGSNKKPLLESVRYELGQIHDSYERLEVQELIPCNCAQCKGTLAPEAYPYDLLMRYIGNYQYDIECRRSFNRVDVRRLISDITDQSARYDIAEKERNVDYLDERKRRYLTQSSPNIYQDNRTITNINQYGDGDNVGGNKLEDDLDNAQTHNKQALTQLSSTLKALLTDLEQDYNPNTPRGQANIQREALATIQQDTSLQEQLASVFQSGNEEALVQLISHPLASTILQGVKEFI